MPCCRRLQEARYERLAADCGPTYGQAGPGLEVVERSPHIELLGVGKRYRNAHEDLVVLDQVDASIKHGEFVALVGRSGSGKSTLLNLIGGLDWPTSGEVRLAGRSLSSMSEYELARMRRQQVGFVFQAFNLLPTLTVLENLLLALELNDRVEVDARERALRVLEEVGLRERADAFPEHLSGGEQQRVAAARATVHGPSVVLADEPTGNLDLETAGQVIEALETRCREAGCTLLMATHSQEVIGRADRIMTIRNARLEG